MKQLFKRINIGGFGIIMIGASAGISTISTINTNEKLSEINNLTITNGKTVKYGTAPWFTTITDKTNPKSNFGLGGVLINDQWVLSCGHDNVSITVAMLRFNMYNRKYNNFKNIVVRESSKIIINPVYLKTGVHSDLSLIKLNKPVTNLPHIQLPTTNIKVGESATVYGYGVSSVKDGHTVFPIHLQKGTVPVLDPNIAKKFPYGQFNPKNEILAGNLTGKRIGAALADSGGPLIKFENNHPVLEGIVNRGVVHYNAGWVKAYPGIYSSVYQNLNWIMNTIKNN